MFECGVDDGWDLQRDILISGHWYSAKLSVSVADKKQFNSNAVKDIEVTSSSLEHGRCNLPLEGGPKEEVGKMGKQGTL